MTWQRGSGSYGRIQAITRPAGGTWSPPADLSPTNYEAFGGGPAISTTGEAVVLWSQRPSQSSIWTAQARVRSPGNLGPGRNDLDPFVETYAAGLSRLQRAAYSRS
jgi:hypothetical protein